MTHIADGPSGAAVRQPSGVTRPSRPLAPSVMSTPLRSARIKGPKAERPQISDHADTAVLAREAFVNG